MNEAWVNGSTRKWRNIRAYVLRRDGYRCQLKLAGCTLADQVHHTLGREVSGDDPAHLVAACGRCNGSMGDPRGHDPAPVPRTRW